jgi:hypothetical protein
MVDLPWHLRILKRIDPQTRKLLESISSRGVRDEPGWMQRAGGRRWDNDERAQNQLDALTAWRKSPIARRIVSLTTDYVIGDAITLRSTYKPLQAFITDFWNHPSNHLELRLPDISDEITRSGELFPVLHLQPDGLSLIRFVPAADILSITWKPGDYETELTYTERAEIAAEPTTWHSPTNAPDATAWMLHYAINRPIGALRGESDLAPIIIWLKRYSGWLEDRARLNWAARAFLWLVTVPTNKIESKRAQYAVAPEPGSVIVKDEGESWEMITPALAARDASADGKAMRYMIAAGAGVPLHMLGEAEGTNLATAQAQEDPTLRHYRRRQLYLSWMLKDIVIIAYNRWRLYRSYSHRPRICSHADIEAQTQDINRNDNAMLASSARDIVAMLGGLRDQLSSAGIQPSDELNKRTIDLAFRFAGEILSSEEIIAILGGNLD